MFGRKGGKGSLITNRNPCRFVPTCRSQLYEEAEIHSFSHRIISFFSLLIFVSNYICWIITCIFLNDSSYPNLEKSYGWKTLFPSTALNISGFKFQRVLVLAVPSLYAWITGFYIFFHLYLNIIAEILRFGDREFYRDWWNSTTIDQYWRLWNIPVHKWMVW